MVIGPMKVSISWEHSDEKKYLCYFPPPPAIFSRTILYLYSNRNALIYEVFFIKIIMVVGAMWLRKEDCNLLKILDINFSRMTTIIWLRRLNLRVELTWRLRMYRGIYPSHQNKQNFSTRNEKWRRNNYLFYANIMENETKYDNIWSKYMKYMELLKRIMRKRQIASQSILSHH